MNKLTIIGNLTADPEARVTANGTAVTQFTIAVNGRGQNAEATFFRVSAWNKTGENCKQYLAKGRKVCVIGSVSAHAYKTQTGEARASLEVNAQEVEFLSSRADAQEAPPKDAETGFETVPDSDLPF